jgi:PKD repeat protein
VTNSGPKVTHAWTNAGVWPVQLTVVDAAGQTNLAGTTVTFTPGAPPVAAIDGPAVVDETSASAGIWTATFHGTNSTDDVRLWKYDWNFGNGKTGSGSTATTTFTGATNYTIRLTVTDHAGQTNSTTLLVTVKANDPPVPAITGPALVDETTATNGTWYAPFSGASSTDDVALWKYDWNFGNGRTASGRTVMGNWTAVGNYTVTLTVTDHAGQARATNQLVTVTANALPVPAIGGQRLLTEAVAANGLWFGSFDGLGSTDDTGVYRWDWKFGDGSTGSGARVTHNYAGAGVYPLALTVYDHGNQSVTLTQSVIVIAGNPPVPRIDVSTLTPEGAQPITLSAANATDDYGILAYRWLLPPQVFTFDGPDLDTNQWRSANATQLDKMIVTGKGGWGQSYFFARSLQIARGAALDCRADTPSGSGTHAMIGLRDLNASPGNYGDLVYAIYFNDGGIYVYEYGNNRGQMTSYAKGTAYDIRIESKPGAGARYYLRPSGSGQPFAKIYESSNYGDALMGVGVDVYSSVFSFDDLVVTPSYGLRDITVPVWPGGPVTLEVVDNALQTNAAFVIVAPTTGAPPVAVISGPTNGLTGVELAFNGYGSSDDHAIASYAWDFGDGSPQVLGPAVNHHYGTAGAYTNTLTVTDYAGQSSRASLLLTIGGSNSLVCVPWLIINGVLQPHEVYSGKTNTLKAVAYGIPVPFTNIWDYGDGSGSVTNVVSTAAAVYNLEARHAYTGGDGTPYYARATVVLTNGTTYSDTYFLVLRPKTLDTEMKVAIDEGLWYLQKAQNRYDFDAHNKGGDWTANGYKLSATASAVQAFAINGHLMTDDPARDPYVETVQRGVNYVLNNLTTVNIGPQTYGDPDGNHNGIALSANNSRPIYETGPAMDCLVAVGRPELIAPFGGANVKGRALRDIVQDLVDLYCWAQSDYTDNRGGGWRYGLNDGGMDNSACQWAAIGMFAAEQFWGIAVPDWVKGRNLVWMAYSSNGNGFGYDGPGEGIATTPSGLVQLAFDGVATTNALWMQGERYVANNWAGGQNYAGANNIYANYAVAKAMRTANPQPVHNLAATARIGSWTRSMAWPG